MDGWTFAAAALGVVLCFEFVLFRYFTPDRSAPGGPAGASERRDEGPGAGGTGERAGRVTRDSEGDGAEADRAVVCEACGTSNANEPALVFCRSCLGRLR